jgi:hypothetical protein
VIATFSPRCTSALTTWPYHGGFASASSARDHHFTIIALDEIRRSQVRRPLLISKSNAFLSDRRCRGHFFPNPPAFTFPTEGFIFFPNPLKLAPALASAFPTEGTEGYGTDFRRELKKNTFPIGLTGKVVPYPSVNVAKCIKKHFFYRINRSVPFR